MLISQKCDNTKLQFWLLQTSLIDDEVELSSSLVMSESQFFYTQKKSHIQCADCLFVLLLFFCHICIKYHFSSRSTSLFDDDETQRVAKERETWAVRDHIVLDFLHVFSFGDLEWGMRIFLLPCFINTWIKKKKTEIGNVTKFLLIYKSHTEKKCIARKS